MEIFHKVRIVVWCVFIGIPLISCKNVNVILFILDDLRPALGCYGDKNAYTPNIDQLAKGSVLFSHSYAQQALCAPSRNSFLTSRRPDTLRLYDFYSYWREIAGNFTTLPQFFRENGYNTMSIGKVFHPGVSSNYSDDQPYSWTFPPFHPKTEIYKNAKVCFTKGNPFPQSNVVCPVNIRLQPDRTLPDIESAFKAIDFLLNIKQTRKPFFLAVGFHKPHIPLKYPQQFKKFHPLHNIVLPYYRRKPAGLPNVAWNPWTDLREREDIKELNITFPFGVIKDKQAKLIIQSYYAAVSYIDDLIGRILKTLTESQNRNTIIALLGDHGWSLGEHGEWSKYSNFDVATRVPLIIKVPGLTDSIINVKNYSFLHDTVELVDLFPTLVDLAGLKSVEPCGNKSKTSALCTEGKSLLTAIMSVIKSIGKRGKEDLNSFSQYPRPGEYPTIKPNSDKPKLKEIKVMGCSLRSHRFRYTEWLGFHNFSIKWSDIKASELYDHFIDPMEANNLSKDVKYSMIKKELSKKLRFQWKKESSVIFW